MKWIPAAEASDDYVDKPFLQKVCRITKRFSDQHRIEVLVYPCDHFRPCLAENHISASGDCVDRRIVVSGAGRILRFKVGERAG